MYQSLSARRAWIEIQSGCFFFSRLDVALRKESVDRNVYQLLAVGKYAVALRKESVDRNKVPRLVGHGVRMSLSARRAWIEIVYPACQGPALQSLSARRAWIEIFLLVLVLGMPTVALRKESVDRNPLSKQCAETEKRSLSARRAWIEIIHRRPHYFYLGVALRKESVDRNLGDQVLRVFARVALRKESVDRNLNTVQIVVVIV